MPKKSLDWLGVVTLWIGAIVLALKSAAAPLLPGAPAILAAKFWNVVPAVLVTIAVLIFIYRQLWPVRAEAALTPTPPEAVNPNGKDSNEGTLQSLSDARDGAAHFAIRRGTERSRANAFHQLDAVMLTIEKKFGIKPLQIPDSVAESPDYETVLALYVQYVDRFSALLREGHIDHAREKAATFKNPWGLSQA